MVTFSRLRSGNWGLRSETELKVGTVVKVTTKNGETKQIVVGNHVWNGNGVYLYGIASSQQDSGTVTINRSSGYTGRVPAGTYAPHGRRCPECGSRECERAWNIRALCDND